ncbi:MAG: rod shape-determining protein RodA [Bacteroidales bacterium]|nr:rod shape-determining protein RodA [Bacteroidales bacterium]
MRQSELSYRHIDWVIVICYLLLTFFGWINIYASSFSEEASGMLNLGTKAGMQFIWISISIGVACALIFFINPRWYLSTTWLLYLGVLILLVGVLVFGKEVNGSKSWFSLGSVSFQPSELSKITTSLGLATVMSHYNFKINRWHDLLKVLLILGIPAGLIILEPEMGTILVYVGFLFVLYREGLTGWIIFFLGLVILLFILTLKFSPFVSMLVLLGIFGLLRGGQARQPLICIPGYLIAIVLLAFLPRLITLPWLAPLAEMGSDLLMALLLSAFCLYWIVRLIRRKEKKMKWFVGGLIASLILIFCVEFIFDKVLQPHHQARIENLLGIRDDPHGIGYNVNQSMIAIGSGGFSGKGFLEGTQTKFKFVPEQSTDFIFCTVGEEWGFLGSFGLLAVFFILITRLLITAERQKEASIRIYGYCVAAIFFMHILINIGMTIGLMPVIGIPLPLISYGGSSLLAFTVLLFMYVRMDLERWRR